MITVPTWAGGADQPPGIEMTNGLIWSGAFRGVLSSYSRKGDYQTMNATQELKGVPAVPCQNHHFWDFDGELYYNLRILGSFSE